MKPNEKSHRCQNVRKGSELRRSERRYVSEKEAEREREIEKERERGGERRAKISQVMRSSQGRGIVP